jgi:hypothetical protein
MSNWESTSKELHMRAAAVALTLLVAVPALADDPIVMNERMMRDRLDRLEDVLER